MFLCVQKKLLSSHRSIKSISISVCLVTSKIFECKESTISLNSMENTILSCLLYFLCVLFFVFRSCCWCCQLSAVVAGGSFLTSYFHKRRYNDTSTLTLLFVILYSLCASSPLVLFVNEECSRSFISKDVLLYYFEPKTISFTLRDNEIKYNGNGICIVK